MRKHMQVKHLTDQLSEIDKHCEHILVKNVMYWRRMDRNKYGGNIANLSGARWNSQFLVLTWHNCVSCVSRLRTTASSDEWSHFTIYPNGRKVTHMLSFLCVEPRTQPNPNVPADKSVHRSLLLFLPRTLADGHEWGVQNAYWGTFNHRIQRFIRLGQEKIEGGFYFLQKVTRHQLDALWHKIWRHIGSKADCRSSRWTQLTWGSRRWSRSDGRGIERWFGQQTDIGQLWEEKPKLRQPCARLQQGAQVCLRDDALHHQVSKIVTHLMKHTCIRKLSVKNQFRYRNSRVYWKQVEILSS